ncbi:hypothetical protein ACQEU3_17960 [Spirillospora sp. CA-253888]
MRRLLSLATAVTLTSTVLAIPATAHAAVRLTKATTTAFDHLAPERVATITVGAVSTSGVKEIRAELRHLSAAAEPYTTLTAFTRTAGTDEDGTWQAVYRPDIESRPGLTIIKIIVTDRDGATAAVDRGFRDCYATDVVDLAAQPAVLDAGHPNATVRGRLVFRKSRAEEPQPVPSLRVTSLSGRTDATTGADGGFTLATQGPYDAGVVLPATGSLCSLSKAAPVTVRRQATTLEARMAVPQPMPAWELAELTGKAMRRTAAGMAPAGGAGVLVRFQGRSGSVEERTVSTSSDGTFTALLPRENGNWSARVQQSAFHEQSAEVAGQVLFGPRTTQITGSNAGPEPVARRDSVTITGTLKRTGGDLIENAVLDVEFSANGKTGWKRLGQARSDRHGKATGSVSNVQASGYWRLRYRGDEYDAPATGWADHVEVRDRTYIYNFNASPEPVRKGRTVTVKGDLHRMTGKPAGTMTGQKVSFYFLPKGAKKWTYLAGTTTDRKGHFSRGFKAVQDGTWRAYYAGSSAFIKWHADDYVDVR